MEEDTSHKSREEKNILELVEEYKTLKVKGELPLRDGESGKTNEEHD